MATPLARLDGVQASLHERAQAKREAEKVYPAHASLARLLMRRGFRRDGGARSGRSDARKRY